MTEPETVTDVAKRESTKQSVILVFSLAGTLGTLYIIQRFSEPDSFRTLKMLLALKAKRIAQAQADWWQDKADKAASAYNREKL